MTAAEFRQALVDGLSDLSLGTFAVSSELPWEASGTPLYTKNLKVFYVDEPDSEQTSLINVLCGGSGVSQRVTTISVFVTVDAKQQPTNYDALVESVIALSNTSSISGVYSRECDVITSFEADLLITEFVFRFTDLVT